ncbi:FAD-binding protein [Demequina oxidasica]|uniref:FAD-binding protein n=1 Tax=Demequina oxidasica TaxID=676199 RepID=UPI0007802D1B|nr:FAD-binding protein [Demequina oxidasica]
MSDVGGTWAGTHQFVAAEVFVATTIVEAQEAVRRAASTGTRVRALGTRHSFTDLADSSGTLVTVTGIAPDPVIDEAAMTVTVGAGVAYGNLATWLESQGFALHNMGSLPHISVAGAVATGTHGSGVKNGSLATAVAALEYVDARGEVMSLARGDKDFEALVVGLGAYGIVTRITLDIQPSYAMRQDVYSGLPWETLLADVDAVVGAGYSVSLFTTWAELSLEQVWVKSRVDASTPLVPATWLGATRLTTPTNLVGGDPAALTEQLGAEGRWLDRLPHFRLENTPSNGDEIQTEYFVPLASAAEALAAVQTHASAIAPHLLVTELRTVAADELWLSGAFERETLAIHFTWRNSPAQVRMVLPLIEAALEPFAARPHWGKLHLFDGVDIERVTPMLGAAREVFERLDPTGMFSNDHLERLWLRVPRDDAPAADTTP